MLRHGLYYIIASMSAAIGIALFRLAYFGDAVLLKPGTPIHAHLLVILFFVVALLILKLIHYEKKNAE